MPRHCSDAPPAELLAGIDQFNAGYWFACHETLEELWAGEQGDARDLYQGILQVAVALHHWREGNYKGAMILCDSSLRLLDRVTPHCQGVDVSRLLNDVTCLRSTLEQLGEERMGALDSVLIPRIRLVAESS
ncbi:MAG: DUF309 domain-containing protein [Desulfuromonadales bacterium]|nr:MAG: DUF309 domain-containing protein [Desulfuromonadales bacterium]